MQQGMLCAHLAPGVIVKGGTPWQPSKSLPEIATKYMDQVQQPTGTPGMCVDVHLPAPILVLQITQAESAPAPQLALRLSASSHLLLL